MVGRTDGRRDKSELVQNDRVVPAGAGGGGGGSGPGVYVLLKKSLFQCIPGAWLLLPIACSVGYLHSAPHPPPRLHTLSGGNGRWQLWGRGRGVLPHPLSFPRGGVGDHHLLNPKFFVAAHCVVVAKPPPKSAAQSIPVESGEHVQEFKVKGSRTKKFTSNWLRSRSPAAL